MGILLDKISVHTKQRGSASSRESRKSKSRMSAVSREGHMIEGQLVLMKQHTVSQTALVKKGFERPPVELIGYKRDSKY